MPTCQICAKEFSMLTNTHVKQHGMTLQAYRDAYPDSCLISDDLHTRFSENGKKQNKARNYEGLGAKISATKLARKAEGKDYGLHVRGKKRTPEQIEHLSASTKAAYANGERVHWAIGQNVNAEVRAKISSSLKLRAAPAVASRQALVEAKNKLLKEAKQQIAEDNARKLSNDLADRGLTITAVADGHCSFQCACGNEARADKTRP